MLVELVALFVQYVLIMVGGYLIVGLWELACNMDAYEKGESYEYRLVNLLEPLVWIDGKIRG